MKKNEPSKNPDWTEAELTLALDTYYQLLLCGEKISDNNTKIVQTSKILNSLEIHPLEKRNGRFRDPPGVKRRIGYFQRLESGERITGRQAYIRVWEKYRKDKLKLHFDALKISNALSFPADEPQDIYSSLRHDIISIRKNKNIDITEKEELIRARRGQGLFRRYLLALWRACPITGCTETSLLKASHIKPWSTSSNHERLDPYNGILLTPTFDTLFDKGYISFDDFGKILISKSLAKSERDALGVREAISIKISASHIPYLRHHRSKVFKS